MFFVLPYFEPFSSHATSNVCIYFQQKLFYSHSVGDTDVALSQKRWEIQKISSHVFLFFHIQSHLLLTQPRTSVYISNKSCSTATLLEIQRWLLYRKDREYKKREHVIFCFAVFGAVQFSRNLELLYI